LIRDRISDARGKVEQKLDDALEAVRRDKDARGELRLSPEEEARIRTQLLEGATERVKKEARPMLKKARYAEGTRGIEQDLKPTKIQDMVPAVHTGSRKYSWVPRVGTMVKALWAQPDGEKDANVTGRWWQGKVTKLTWPTDKGTPGVEVKYACGHTEWHGLNTCGITVLPVAQPAGKSGRQHDTMFPAQATSWMGIGTRLSVKWGRKWMPGKVIGDEGTAKMVRYDDGSVVPHTDIHTRGCRVLEFRRDIDPQTYYSERPWIGCPYDGEEDDCKCEPCETKKWPAVYSREHCTEEQIQRLQEMAPEHRRQWIAAQAARGPTGRRNPTRRATHALPTAAQNKSSRCQREKRERPPKAAEDTSTGHSKDRGPANAPPMANQSKRSRCQREKRERPPKAAEDTDTGHSNTRMCTRAPRGGHTGHRQETTETSNRAPPGGHTETARDQHKVFDRGKG
jgi:hypothetical protein